MTWPMTESRPRARPWRWIAPVVVLAYPPAVYFGLRELAPRALALMLLVLLAPGLIGRIRVPRRDLVASLGPITPAVLLAITTAVVGDPLLLLLAPALVNVALAIAFGGSLRRGAKPMVERFARLQEPDLPDDAVPYCRNVTIVWTFFLVANATTCAVLAIAAPRSWWALYTGLIAYVLLGALFTVEYVVRKARFRRYGDTLPDRMLSAVFPPRRS
jgi:uncharacterized membrane protein